MSNLNGETQAPLSLCNILPGVDLPTFQREGMRRVFLNNKMLLAFDTGTGKTFSYAGIVRGLINANPEKKHLLIIINDSIPQVPNDVRRLTKLSVESFDGTAESIGRLRFFWDRTSIFCLTIEALMSFSIVKFLFDKLPEIESVTIDEAHHMSNWDHSDTAFMLRALVKLVPYVVELSATPVTRVSKQYYRLMNLLDRNMSPHRDETYLGKYVDRYMPVNREDYEIKGNYVPKLIVVQPTLDQMQEQHGIVFRHLKGTGAVPQVEALCDFVQDRLAQGKRVIVYVHYHDTRNWVEFNFNGRSIGFTSVHGRLRTKADKTVAIDRFKNGDVDVLITSVTESLNIEADVVVFYEFTTSVKQVIGRAHRGLEGKTLEIAFIITKDTDEVDYFLKYIYERSLLIQKLLCKDYSELIAIGEEVEQLRSE